MEGRWGCAPFSAYGRRHPPPACAPDGVKLVACLVPATGVGLKVGEYCSARWIHEAEQGLKLVGSSAPRATELPALLALLGDAT